MVQASVCFALTGCSYTNVQKYRVLILECKKKFIFRYITGTYSSLKNICSWCMFVYGVFVHGVHIRRCMSTGCSFNNAKKNVQF